MKHLFTIAMLLTVTALYAKSEKVWTMEYQSLELIIYSSYAECHDVANGIHKEKVLLKFENLTNKAMDVTYKKEMWYDEQCLGCEENSTEYTYSVTLLPNESKAGDCATKDKTWYIFSKFLNRKTTELSRFVIKNIELKTEAK